MKIKIAAILCFALLLTSCATTKVKEPRVPDENYLGDFSPFELEDVICLTHTATGGSKPCEIRLYAVPRSNNVEAYFTYNATQFCIMLSYKERLELLDGITAYMNAYNAKNLPERKPEKSNAFTRTKTSLAWGMLGLARSGDGYFRTNYEYIEPGKPYFLLTIEPTSDKEDSSVMSPLVKLYFSPSQLEQLVTSADQEFIEEHVAELAEQAFGF